MGSVILDGFGGTYESILIAASPTLEAVDGSNGSWSYSLRLNEWQGGAGFITSESGANDGKGCESCSQFSSAPRAPSSRLPLALLVLGLLAARRHQARPPRL